MDRKAIEIRGLHFKYPDGTKALCGVDLDVFTGESLGLIGPNGAGKSTLLLHLNGILRGGSAIKILSEIITEKNLAFIRAKVGMIFQEPENQLFMPTVADDVGFGPINMGLKKEEVEQAINDALAEVDMLDFRSRSPHHMSIGEKKRVALATILSMRPEIIVLDEPSSNLDPRHRRGLIRDVEKAENTKVLATHDLDLVSETCSRVALLAGGKIISIGSTSDILGDKNMLERNDVLYSHKQF